MITKCLGSAFIRDNNPNGRLLMSHTWFKMATKCLSTKTDCNDNLRVNSPYKHVTHVIFDLDGLLLDTEVIYRKILSEMVEGFGKKYTSEIQLKVLGTTEQTTAQIVVNECKLPVTAADFILDFRKRQIVKLANADLMDGAEHLVRHLHKNNVPIAIATSSGAESVKVKTSKHQELFCLFSHIVMGSSDPEVKNGKPAPDVFKVCADRFSDKPDYSKCLVFEDAPNGVTGAVAAGMQTVMVPDKDLPVERTKDATVVLKSLLDFRPEIFGLPAF